MFIIRDGKLIDHEAIKVSLRWHFQRLHGKPHKVLAVIKIKGAF